MESIETNTTYRVLEVSHLTGDTFRIRFERNGMQFKAGQHIVMGVKGDSNTREYSIYSGENDDNLEILVKSVEEGYLTHRLKSLSPGDKLDVHGPMGYFTIDPRKIASHHFALIASGTGIAPFRSFIRTYPGLDYTLVHGIQYAHEAYDKDEYDSRRYISCTSQDMQGTYHGRVTGYLKHNDFPSNTLFYFCGNSDMIFDAMEVLKGKGYDPNKMFTEVYY